MKTISISRKNYDLLCERLSESKYIFELKKLFELKNNIYTIKMKKVHQSIILNDKLNEIKLFLYENDIMNEIKPTEIKNTQPEIINTEVKKTENVKKIKVKTKIKEKIIKDNWHHIYSTVTGIKHLLNNPPIPCQDSVNCSNKIRPILIVSDGAGSASLSHFGSKELVNKIMRYLATTEDINKIYLDSANEFNDYEKENYAFRIVKHAVGVLEDLANENHHDISKYYGTLLLTVLGKNKLFYLKIGDGAIVIEKNNKELESLGFLGKGEFANQTSFVSPKLQKEDIQYGFINSIDITGISLFTDGIMERLIHFNSNTPAKIMNNFFDDLRNEKMNITDLNDFLTDKDVWRGTTGDDKGIVLFSLEKKEEFIEKEIEIEE